MNSVISKINENPALIHNNEVKNLIYFEKYILNRNLKVNLKVLEKLFREKKVLQALTLNINYKNVILFLMSNIAILMITILKFLS